MQKRAGLLYLSLKTQRILLILENEKWTVPTFQKNNSIIQDSVAIQDKFSKGRILPIELYLSKDKGFEFNTYICLLDEEFLINHQQTYCWSELDRLPKNVHIGLRSTLNNNLIRTKIQTVLELENAFIN